MGDVESTLPIANVYNNKNLFAYFFDNNKYQYQYIRKQ